MPRLGAHGRVDQLVREGRCDLLRMVWGAWAKSGRMKISKCPFALRRLSQHAPIARLLRPAQVKPMANRTRSGRCGRRRIRATARRVAVAGEGGARPFPLETKIFAGAAGDLMRASSPPARASVAQQGRAAKGGSVGAQRR
jgi:hypothetical protein